MIFTKKQVYDMKQLLMHFLLLPSLQLFSIDISIDISVWLGPGSIDVGLIAGRRGLAAMGA